MNMIYDIDIYISYEYVCGKWDFLVQTWKEVVEGSLTASNECGSYQYPSLKIWARGHMTPRSQCRRDSLVPMAAPAPFVEGTIPWQGPTGNSRTVRTMMPHSH